MSSAKQNSGFKVLRFEEAKIWPNPVYLTLILLNAASRVNIFS